MSDKPNTTSELQTVITKEESDALAAIDARKAIVAETLKFAIGACNEEMQKLYDEEKELWTATLNKYNVNPRRGDHRIDYETSIIHSVYDSPVNP